MDRVIYNELILVFFLDADTVAMILRAVSENSLRLRSGPHVQGSFRVRLSSDLAGSQRSFEQLAPPLSIRPDAAAAIH